MEIAEYWERVKALIKSRNTTQEGLAKTCGIPFHTLQGQIVKNRLPNTFDGYKIARALGTTVEYLVTGGDDSPLAAENRALLEKIRMAIAALS